MHKIWIADDDEAIRLVLEESLSSSGFDTSSFSSADELVKSLENSEPDLIITDVQMPGICLLYTSPSPRDRQKSRMPSSA